MRIQGYRVEYRRDTRLVQTEIGGGIDLQGNTVAEDCWKVHIHVKSFNLSREKFNQISSSIIEYLLAEAFITRDIPIKFQVFDILGKPIYINKFTV